MLAIVKDYYRRWQLDRRGLVAEAAVPTFTAGERSGVWTVCPDGLGPDSVVYSFGVGDNLAWDRAMARRFGVAVHAFDPTPASVAWVAAQALPPEIRFHPVGLAGHDGTVALHLPPRGSRFNFRAGPGRPDAAAIDVPVARLTTLMARLGHGRIDVLKLDVEGGEYAALDDLLASGVRPGQVLVEFHHHFAGFGIGHTERAVRALRAAGYRAFHRSKRGLEFSFLHASAGALAAACHGRHASEPV